MYRRRNRYDRVRNWQILDRYPIVWTVDLKWPSPDWSAIVHVWGKNWPESKKNWKYTQIHFTGVVLKDSPLIEAKEADVYRARNCIVPQPHPVDDAAE